MTNTTFARLNYCVALFLVLGGSVAQGADQVPPAAHAVVPGYERFRSSQLSPEAAGRLLISELNCQSCHGTILQEVLPQRSAPILTGVSGRVQFEHLKSFIADPQGVKPGTAMPQVFSEGDREQAALALAHFLASDGAPVATPVASAAILRGEKLFHTLGCAACHADQRMSPDKRPAYAMPLGKPDDKYTAGSLIAFLKDPHAVRPSGRMPSLNLTDEEARDVANYLLKDIKVEPNLTVDYYEGNWDQLPNFDELKPGSTGPASGFDVAASPRKDGFALRFRGFVHIPRDGDYQFWLGSDDGSRLLVNGREVIRNDGIHPHTVRDAKISLTPGAHPVVVEYFEKGGEESLSVEISGPQVPRQPLSGMVSNSEVRPEKEQGFETSPDLVAEGRRLFMTSGCASCHQHNAVKPDSIPARTLPQFAALNPVRGCLADASGPGIPQFALTEQQRADIVAAVKSLSAESKSASPEATIGEVMLTLNCYACHQRNKTGGVPTEQDHLFTGSIPEMGDEGRIPPHLDGVGDKLQTAWLKQVMNRGAKDRPYMATRMPRFGERNVGRLVELVAENDIQTKVADVAFEEPPHRVKADARLMVGDQALSCIKCHYFDKYKATGIQSLDMTTMTTRLRRDWFHRYLLNPQAYRPGTRMPAAWPNNKSVVPKILHGDPGQQIEAIWLYLADGKQAKIPSGLVAGTIELKPTDRPLIYRNFIQGLTARGIAVGYPEKAHLAWDAEQMNLRLIWHGAFIDASKHWIGRGPGFQTPLGDHVMTLTPGPPLAVLDNLDQEWPSQSAREAGYAFKGYRLNDAHQPAFHYEWRGMQVIDFPEPVAGDKDASLKRTLTLSAAQPLPGLSLRIASTSSIEQQADGWLVDNAILLRFNEVQPVTRTIQGRQELIVPVGFDNTGQAVVQYEMIW